MTVIRWFGVIAAAAMLLEGVATAGQAGPADPAAQAAQAPAPAPPVRDPDRNLNFNQPDFTIITLPTTVRLPRHKSAFRVTHRFGRPLGQGDLGDLAGDLFGLDSGAVIGLEYRYAIIRGLQVGFHRTSGKTIEFFGEYTVLQQSASRPIGLGVITSVDGTNNFRDRYSPSVGLAISRELGRRGAVYFEPIWVNNSNPLPTALADHNDTMLLGVGARIRVRPTVYLVGEIVPRTGFTPGVNHATFGIEKRAGGHTFQMNFSNGFATTMGQLARGGFTNDDWYLGFNISRKFYQ
jgi:hypothetical protein